MNKLLAAALFFLICFSACSEKQTDTLADIRRKYTKINDQLKDLTLKEVEDITSAGGGNINGYYKDKEIKKIYWEHFTDTNRVFTEYYFDDGMLIYAVEQDFVYNKPRTYTEEIARQNNDTDWYDDRKTRLLVSRYFLKKNKLIKWLAPGNVDMAVNTSDFTDKQSELWAKAALLIKELNEQN